MAKIPWLLVLLAIGQADPQQVAPEAEQAKAFARETAQRLVMRIGEAPAVEMSVSKEPVFRWTNQLGRRFFGDVYVWTRHGRPEVVVSITSVFGNRRKFEIELHSLSADAPTLADEGKVIWKPNRPGVFLKPVPNTAAPTKSTTSRLREMRSLASRFVVSGEYDNTVRQLRLIRGPIFRYESSNPAVLDGALFAFVNGTDPDAFLIIESRKDSAGDFEWQFALARFNGNCSLQASFDDHEVWRVGRLSRQKISDAKEPYFAMRGEW